MYLWGLHRITGYWKRLQGPSDQNTLEQYQVYFAKETLEQAYAHVPFSGMKNDNRPLYIKFKICKNKPRLTEPR